MDVTHPESHEEASPPGSTAIDSPAPEAVVNDIVSGLPTPPSDQSDGNAGNSTGLNDNVPQPDDESIASPTLDLMVDGTTPSPEPVAHDIVSGLSTPSSEEADDEGGESTGSDSSVTLLPADGAPTSPHYITPPPEPMAEDIVTTGSPTAPGNEIDDEASYGTGAEETSGEADDEASESSDSNENLIAQSADESTTLINDDGHTDESSGQNSASSDEASESSYSNGSVNAQSADESPINTNDGDPDENSSETSEISDEAISSEDPGESQPEILPANRCITWACTRLLSQPRETWADTLDRIFDPYDCIYQDIPAETRELMKDLCRGVADARRGGTGYFKPELYRPFRPFPGDKAEGPDLFDRGPDLFDRGPDPYDDGPEANYEGQPPGRPTAIQRYHCNNEIWNHCDDLLNLGPDRWMPSLPGVVHLIFDPRARGNPKFSYLAPETTALLNAIRNAFDGVPPPDVPGRMSRSGRFFQFDSTFGLLDLHCEIEWVPRMRRDEMLASIPGRASHILMYGRPMPDRRLEEQGRPVTSRGARALNADYHRILPRGLFVNATKEQRTSLHAAYVHHTTTRADAIPEDLHKVSKKQRAALGASYERLMVTRAAALAHHDAIDAARARYRAELACVNRPLATYMLPFHGSPSAVPETIAALERAAKAVRRERRRAEMVVAFGTGRRAEVGDVWEVIRDGGERGELFGLFIGASFLFPLVGMGLGFVVEVVLGVVLEVLFWAAVEKY